MALVGTKFYQRASRSPHSFQPRLTGTGGYFVHSIAVDGINLWTSCKLTSCIIYLTLSFGINFVFTAGIVCRLFYGRREFGGVLGSEVGRVYTSTAAMLIESASLHTVVSLLAIIACARRIPFQGALMPMLGQLHVRPVYTRLGQSLLNNIYT